MKVQTIPYQGIIVRVLPATNTKPHRYKVWATGNPSKSKMTSFHAIPCAYDNTSRAYVAAQFIAELGWAGDWVCAELPNGDWVYVAQHVEGYRTVTI